MAPFTDISVRFPIRYRHTGIPYLGSGLPVYPSILYFNNISKDYRFLLRKLKRIEGNNDIKSIIIQKYCYYLFIAIFDGLQLGAQIKVVRE